MRFRFLVVGLLLAGLASGTACKRLTRGSRAALARGKRIMLSRHLKGRGIDDPRVLGAMTAVKREEFVPPLIRFRAYEDNPLPIGRGQTISQPYIVAFMAQAAGIKPGARVLEIGTGSGYGAAVLGRLARKVYTVEILSALAASAGKRLARLGYRNVTVRQGDGYAGWRSEAPFDAIVVTAAAPTVPGPLKRQLKVGGRLVIPVGRRIQHMLLITRTRKGYKSRRILPVRFVPMIGRAQQAP